MSNPSIQFTLSEPGETPSYGAVTAAAFARMLRHLLPPGRVWLLEPDAELSKVLLAAGDELERLDQRGRDLIEEADARTTDELLADFERVLELEATGTDDERRARVVALLIRRQRFRPVDFQQVLAPLLGQDPEDVVVMEQSRAFAISVADDREIYRFFIYRDPDLPGDYDIEAAQMVVDAMKPSHTSGHVIETLDFLCDDEFSLCDRDRLGA